MSQILEVSSWNAFKQVCINTKNLNNQYEDRPDRYELFGPDANGILWHTTILKENPRGADQIDFEDNYKINFNWAIGSRPYTFSTSDFIFGGNAILATCTKNATTNVDFQVPGGAGTYKYINGAVAFTSNACFGDYASAVIIDKDNILGYGPDTILSTYIDKWYVNPDVQLDIATPYAGKILAGLYVRVSYTSVGLSADVGLAINYRLHTPI